MHDISDLERRGVPAGMVASTEFVTAAEAQAAAVAFQPAAVFVPHPIQDRTDDEIVALADGAISDIVALICE